MCLCLLAGCNNYHAKLYSHAVEWIDAGFLKENIVRAYYPNDDYVEGVTNPIDEYIYDSESPETRTFIITEQSEFDSIFTKCDLDVDLQNEIVILYILPDVYSNRNYYLGEIQLQENILTIDYKLENKEVDDAVQPYQRCFAVVMDRVEINEVVFIEKK